MSTTRGMWSKRTARVLAVIIVGFYGLDMLTLGDFSPWTLGLRLVWVLSLLGYSAFSSELPEPWARWIEDEGTNLEDHVAASFVELRTVVA